MLRSVLVFIAASAALFGQTFPADDECSTAGTLLVDGINPAPAASGVTFTTAPATTSAGTMCAGFAKDVWFLYVPTNTGTHVINTCTPTGFAAGTIGDTVLAIYDACGGTQLACNDDSCGFRSQVSLVLNAGSLYYVRVASFGATSVGGTFYLTINAPTPPATNDECVASVQIFDGPNVGLGNTSATNSADLSACGVFNNDVWFFYVATFTGLASFSTGCGGTPDTLVAVYDNCGGAELGCNDDTPGCAVGGSTATAAVSTGSVYFVRVGMKSPITASFGLSVAQLPANDECVGAVPLVLGANGPFSNAGATNSAGTATCGAGGNKNDLWYSFTAFCPGVHSVSTGCGGYDTVVSVYDACGGLQLACNDDTPGCGFGGSFATFTATVGSTYLIRVASFTQGASGSFTITIGAGAGFGFAMSAPLGPGSIQADVTGGASGGAYIMALTLAPGTFPNGWLGGLDISIAELLGEIDLGFPFVGGLDLCGAALIGPFPGLPSGLTLYGTAIGLNAPFGNVTGVAPASSFTIP
jgi:hypothetical protein